MLLRTLLATDPALPTRVSPEVRIPTHPVGSSDNIRSVIPGYPVT